MNSRITAAKIIHQVIVKKNSLDSALESHSRAEFGAEDQRFIHELCYGTLRWYHQLLHISQQLLHRPLPTKHQDVFCFLLIGLYQLSHLKTPPYAAISSTVEAVKSLKKPWASGLINKILRLYLQKEASIRNQLEQNPAAKYSHPEWLVNKIKIQWPDTWQDILTANNTQAPLTLRINPNYLSREAYQNELKNIGIESIAITDLPYALQLITPVKISNLPGFDQGSCYVQDQAGQYAALLLQLQKDQSVLDACAAPGSKTTDILATEPKLSSLLAVDNKKERLVKIKENIQRLKLPHENVQLKLADASQLHTIWQKNSFDRILLDAPCSATGVIRRHPDIKLLRQPSDIAKQVKLQRQLLTSLWPLLKPQGLLLYSTCSILKEENEEVIASFIQQEPDAKLLPIKLNQGTTLSFGCQFLPSPKGPDGFYYALLVKNSNR